MNNTNNRKYPFLEVGFVLAGILVLFAVVFLPNILSAIKVRNERLAFGFLPPGTLWEQAPVPINHERHFGNDWVIARGQTNFMTVVYYPNHVEVLSVRPVQAPDVPGMYRYEVSVKMRVGSSLLDQAFWTDVSRPDPNPLFIGLDPKIFEELRSRIPPKK